MTTHAKEKGIQSEAMVIAAFVCNGYTVSLPYGDNARYDLLVDKDSVISRVQIKTMIHKISNCMYVRACSVQKQYCNGEYIGHSVRVYSSSEIDFIAAYSHKLNRVYLIPVIDIDKTNFSLRIGKLKKFGKKKTPPAKRYEFFRFSS